MPTAHKVLVKTGESALSRQSNTSDRSSTKEISGTWSEAEHKLFLQGLEQHGRKWKKIAAVVGTRTNEQVRTHAQNYFAKLETLESAKKLEVEDEPMMCRMSWDERFQQLVEYKEQNRHCRVPRKCKANSQLATWVKNQRTAYRKNKLSAEQIRSLEGIGFVWVLQKQERSVVWDKRLEELKQYRQAKGDCKVPHRCKANPQLGEWVSTQRKAYKKGKLSPEQIRSLEDIGFVWKPPRGGH